MDRIGRGRAVLAVASLLAVPVAASQDAGPAILAGRTAEVAAPGAVAGLAAPRVVFTRSGDDNVGALLARPDANGDRVGEVVVGWDIFKSGDNLETLSGGGYGDGAAVWALATQDGVSGGYFSDIDQLASFPDVTGDGVEELLTGTSGGGRSATLYDGASGEVLQSFDTYLGADSGWVYDVESLGDADGDGTPDFALAVGSDDNAVYAVSGALTGVHHDELWRFAGGDVFYALAVVGDVDGDGVDDLAAGEGDLRQHVHVLSGATGAELWEVELAATVWDLAAYPDVDGDGVDEVIAGQWSFGDEVALLDGATGAALWQSSAVFNYVMRVLPHDDLDGDGRPEIAVASWDDAAQVIDGATGELVWSAPAGGDVWALDLVGDVTGDGVREVAFGSFDGFAYLADGASGSLLWAHDADGHKVLVVAGGADLDGDGTAEVLAGGQQLSFGVEETLLWVLDASSGVPGAAPEVTWEGSPVPGGTVSFRLTGGTPGGTVRWVRGAAPTLREAPAIGWLAVEPPELLGTGTVGPGGAALLQLPLPDDPALVGRELYVQAFVTAAGETVSANRVGFSIEE